MNKADQTAPKVAGVVGGPAQVGLSLSPAIHNAAFRSLDLDWVYLLFGMDTESVQQGIRGLAAGGVRGMNVTLPHKVSALAAMDDLSDSAKRIGALNTVEVRAGILTGWNTDGEGLVRFLTMDAGAEIEGAHVLVIGAGGSARAVVYALASARAKAITVVARDRRKADRLASLAGSSIFSSGQLGAVSSENIEQADILINATPLGQGQEQPPIPTRAIRAGAAVVDLVYRPAVTPLIREARARGALAHSGLGMLLHQAALSFEIWTGISPPMDVMSAGALAELKKAAGSPPAAS